MTEREEILASLAPLFAEAERCGLWFHCNYQDLWFSPKDLRASQAKGNFVWGPVNWKLRDPKELGRKLKDEAVVAKQRLEDFYNNVGYGGEEF